LAVGNGVKHEFYRTGDIVRCDGDGNLIFIGRADRQIKLRGYRVELADIEAALLRAGAVEAVALAFPDASAPVSIVAFATGEVGEAHLIARVRNLIPNYMVPSRVTIVDKMPLNANGKLDRPLITDRVQASLQNVEHDPASVRRRP
jgi:acyl-coenzyme A synthetase/AMP-(fatty) acid ligase